MPLKRSLGEREGESASSIPHKEGVEVNKASLPPSKSRRIETDATSSPHTSS